MPGINQLKQQAVRGLKHLRQLHSNGCQRVDIEKAAVVDLLRSHAPGAEPVGLQAQQLIQPVKVRRIRKVIPAGDDALNGRADRRNLSAEPDQPIADDHALTHAFSDALRGSLRARRQMIDGGEDALQLRRSG